MLICSKRGRLNHHFIFKKCGHFFKRFSTSKTHVKSTALFYRNSDDSARLPTRAYFQISGTRSKIAQASTLVLICSKRGRLNHHFIFKKCGHFFRRFSTSKTLSKSTALFLIETPHKPSSPTLLQYVVKRQVTGCGCLIQNG